MKKLIVAIVAAIPLMMVCGVCNKSRDVGEIL